MATLSEANVAQYLRENPEFMASWFIDHADDNTLRTLARKLKQDAIQSQASRNVSPEQRQEAALKDYKPSSVSAELRAILPNQSKRFLSPDIIENGDLQKYNAFSRVGRNSITSLIFRKYLDGDHARRASVKKDIEDLRRMSEEELLMELIRDIASELDVTVLCHKILQNVSILTNSDRGSLFLVRGSRDAKYLVSKLFDVTESSTLEQSIHTEANEITVPFGVGIAGHVANTRECINIRDVYADPRFNQEVDKKTGYRTHSILSMPILNYEGEVIGVAQIINKVSGNHEFTKQDEALFEKYLTFCGIGITNAQLFEMSLNEYKRNQLLLHLARGIFEEQSNLEKLVQKIMLDAQDLLACEKCSIFLLEDSFERDINRFTHQFLTRLGNYSRSSNLVVAMQDPSNPPQNETKSASPMPIKETKPLPEKAEDVIFSKAFELRDGEIKVPSAMEIAESKNAQIARCTVVSGQSLNVHDLEKDGRFGPGPFTNEDGFQTKSVLCMPIHNSDHVIIGVTQLINKVNGQAFNENDQQIIEAFSIFTGLGIHNCQMYEHACQLMAKQSVALEVLSYHATAGKDETGKYKSDNIQTSEDYRLYAYDFDDSLMVDDDTIKATIRMFVDANLINQFKVPYETMCRWVCTVKKNYRPVTYHNWRHAFNVCQTMFTMLYTGELTPLFDKVEIFAMMVACLCHDLDHRGTNNAFQKKVASPLAMLYSTSVLEHHHFDHCIMILNSEGNNIFQSFSPDEYRRAISILEHSILSTDLALYFKKRGDFKKLVDGGERKFQDPYKKDLLTAMMMTACDVAAITKPWKIQKEIAQLVTAEFFEQGDIEKSQLGQKPIPMMDREKKDELPRMQVEFIDVICTPVYEAFSTTWPRLAPFYDGVLNNRHHWTLMQEGNANKPAAPAPIPPAAAAAPAPAPVVPKQLPVIPDTKSNNSFRKPNGVGDKDTTTTNRPKPKAVSPLSKYPKTPSSFNSNSNTNTKKLTSVKDVGGGGGGARGQKEVVGKKPLLSPIKQNNARALTVYAASLRGTPGSSEKTATADAKRLFSQINPHLSPLEDGCSNNRDQWNHLSTDPNDQQQELMKKDENDKETSPANNGSEADKPQKATESNGHASTPKQTSIEESNSVNNIKPEGNQNQNTKHQTRSKHTTTTTTTDSSSSSRRDGSKTKSAHSDSKKSSKSSKSNFCTLS